MEAGAGDMVGNQDRHGPCPPGAFLYQAMDLDKHSECCKGELQAEWGCEAEGSQGRLS